MKDAGLIENLRKGRGRWDVTGEIKKNLNLYIYIKRNISCTARSLWGLIYNFVGGLFKPGFFFGSSRIIFTVILKKVVPTTRQVKKKE